MRTTLACVGVVASLVLALGLSSTVRAGGPGGHLGLYLEPVMNADGGSALHVRSLQEDGPAAKAGVLEGDTIVSVAGKPVESIEALREVLRAHEPGSTVELGVLRGSKSVTLDVTLGAPPSPLAPDVAPPSGGGAFLGVGLMPVHPALAAHLGLKGSTGVSLGDVREGSPAATAGLQVHDVVVSLDGADLEGPDHLVALLSEHKAGDTVSLGVIHQGARETVEVTLAERPSDLPAIGRAPASPFGAPWGQPWGKSGKITIQGPNGQARSFALPGGAWELEDLMRDMQKEFEDLGQLHAPGQLSEHLRKLLEAYKAGGTGPGLSDVQSSSSQSSVVRVVEGDLDITVRDQDGQRTVDVQRGDEVLAQGLPYDKIDTLEESVRQRVEQVASGIHVESSAPKALPKLEPLPKSTELKA